MHTLIHAFFFACLTTPHRLWGTGSVQLYFYLNVSKRKHRAMNVSYAVAELPIRRRASEVIREYRAETVEDKFSPVLKAILVWVLDTVHPGLIIKIIYSYLVTDFGQPTLLINIDPCLVVGVRRFVLSVSAS